MKAKSLALALALLWATGAGAAQDFNGTNGEASASSVEVTAPAFTVCAWINVDSFTAQRTVISLGNTGDLEHYVLTARGTSDSFPSTILFFASGDSGNGNPVTSSTWTAGVWHHVCGVEASAASRAVYIDGGSKGTNTTNVGTVTTPTHTGVGVRIRTTTDLFFDGRIAEVSIWSAALTDAEVATLAKGFASPCVRRASLVAYYPMVRDTTSLKDQFSDTANNLTLAGTTSVATHPRIINCQ